MRPGEYDEDTDPHYRRAPEVDDSPTIDNSPTKIDSKTAARKAAAPTLLLAEEVMLGHLVHQAEVLGEIRDHAKRSADADVTRSQATGKFLEGATWWVRTGVFAGIVVVTLAALGFLLVVGTSLLLG